MARSYREGGGAVQPFCATTAFRPTSGGATADTARRPPRRRTRPTITPEAQDHIAKLRAAEGPGTHLRMGVKAGGCSGMSYAMDLCKEDDITEQDHVEEWPEGFKVVIDPKSMLYLFGLELGYSKWCSSAAASSSRTLCGNDPTDTSTCAGAGTRRSASSRPL